MSRIAYWLVDGVEQPRKVQFWYVWQRKDLVKSQFVSGANKGVAHWYAVLELGIHSLQVLGDSHELGLGVWDYSVKAGAALPHAKKPKAPGWAAGAFG